MKLPVRLVMLMLSAYCWQEAIAVLPDQQPRQQAAPANKAKVPVEGLRSVEDLAKDLERLLSRSEEAPVSIDLNAKTFRTSAKNDKGETEEWTYRICTGRDVGLVLRWSWHKNGGGADTFLRVESPLLECGEKGKPFEKSCGISFPAEAATIIATPSGGGSYAMTEDDKAKAMQLLLRRSGASAPQFQKVLTHLAQRLCN